MNFLLLEHDNLFRAFRQHVADLFLIPRVLLDSVDEKTRPLQGIRYNMAPGKYRPHEHVPRLKAGVGGDYGLVPL